MLQVDRQPGQVGVSAGQNYLLNGCGFTSDVDDFGFVLQPAQHLRQQLARSGSKGVRHALAAAEYVSRERRAPGAGLLEKHRLRIPVENSPHLRELHRCFVRLELALARERFEEAAQPESVEIRNGWGRHDACTPADGLGCPIPA